MKIMISKASYYGTVRILFYRPQRSCGQGNIFAPVSHSVHRGGVCLGACWDTTPNRSRHPPGADTTQSRHPLGADKLPPRKQTPPPEQTSPWEQTPPGVDMPPLGADMPPGADIPHSRHPPSRHPQPWEQTPPPPGSRLQHTVNERPVRILLECILV